jgi:hypothetical protein
MVKSIIHSLKDKKWSEMENLTKAIINSSNDKLISGILRRNYTIEANELRKEILIDEKRSNVLRARIIEDLFGKKQNDEVLIKIITDLQNSESESISNSAQMFMKSIE